jgi:hypothetical protein
MIAARQACDPIGEPRSFTASGRHGCGCCPPVTAGRATTPMLSRLARHPRFQASPLLRSMGTDIGVQHLPDSYPTVIYVAEMS